MNIGAILENHVLIGAVIAWGLAQVLKIPFEFLRSHQWHWAMIASAGGMPSSHSSLIVAATVGIGLHDGFDTSLFAIALATAMVVVYDAAGVRQQAGVHAQKINVLVNELLSGHPISDKDLREVLGHTPLEVAGGILLGTIVSTLAWMYTK